MEELLIDDDYKFIRSIISFISATFVLIFTVNNFIYTLSAYENMVANDHQIDYVFDNWNKETFADIVPVSDQEHCPEGYESLIK
jgi:hypothetical protein